MTLKNNVCWKARAVEYVMDTEALQTGDHIFLATHYPVKMYRKDLSEAASSVRYDERHFLRDFLSPRDYIFVAVLGEAGTGKSHLIRWLAANIAQTEEKRRVLLIPKVGTNLREVVRLILNNADGEKFAEYRQRLDRVSSALLEGQAREELINQLAMAVGPNGPNSGGSLTELEEYLVRQLPNFLYDPYFREKLLRDGGIIHSLTSHTIGRVDRVQRVESRREISIDDLPLSVTDIHRSSEKAREFYIALASYPDVQQETLKWLNKNLDAAIAQVLNFKGEDLLNLMLEVRESLAEQDIELVILIEDFAKLQGIDHQLLEALLARPIQPNRKPLCRLRTALAATTGYFNQLKDTVRQRIKFRIDLDVKTGDSGDIVTGEDLIRFSALYLNAVRLNDQVLQEWYSSRADSSQPVPKACDVHECPQIDDCHRAFGHVDGMGLYPFTRDAIKIMFDRVSPPEKTFNPRRLINEVLKHTLENYGEHLTRGQFPPPALLEHFGGKKMGASLVSELTRKDPTHYGRRQVLLELWTEGDKLVDLDPVVHQAFDLPPLGDVGVVRHRDQGPRVQYLPDEPPGGEADPVIPDSLQTKLDLLNSWMNGGELPQNLTQELRELVFSAVSNHIDWNAELLLENYFFRGAGRPFQQRSVSFVRQATQPSLTPIQLRIPTDDNLVTATTVALQAMLLYSHFKSWDFPEGAKYFRTYAQQLESWGSCVRKQINHTRKDNGVWDPVPSVVELLALGASMAGQLPPDGVELYLQINALFTDVDSVEYTGRTKPWQDLFIVLLKYNKVLMDILRSRVACTKGTSTVVQVIDVAQVITPLLESDKKGRPVTTIPENLRREYEVIAKVRDSVDDLLEQAISAERERCRAWYQRVKDELGEVSDHPRILRAFRQAVERSRDEGVFPGTSVQSLEEAMVRFETVVLDETLTEIESLGTAGKRESAVLGRLDQEVMMAADSFFDEADRFLDAALKRVQEDVKNIEVQGGQALENVLEAIHAELHKLDHLLKRAEEEKRDSNQGRSTG